MYSFAFGLLLGNSNVVRVSEKKIYSSENFFKYFKKLGNKKIYTYLSIKYFLKLSKR